MLSGFFFGNFAFQETKGTNFPLGSAIKNMTCLKYIKYEVEKTSDDGGSSIKYVHSDSPPSVPPVHAHSLLAYNPYLPLVWADRWPPSSQMFCKLLSIKEPPIILQNKQTTVYTKLSKNVKSKHQKESWDEVCTFQRQRGRRKWIILAF